MDFAYKGDDDTLLLPRNLAYQIRNMKDESTAVGSLKSGEEVLRDIESKYYMPQEIEPFETRPPYFSGAGYVLKGNFALEVAKARHDTPGKYEFREFFFPKNSGKLILTLSERIRESSEYFFKIISYPTGFIMSSRSTFWFFVLS